MKVLVTGASGQLGTAIRQVFRDHTILATDRAELDITDRESVRRFLGTEQPDVIINCAAYNNVEKAGDELFAAFAGNAYGPFFLAEAAKTVDAVLLHVSTDYVFDGMKGEYGEEDSTHPVNAYGVSKLAGELLVRAAWEKSYIVRTSWLFGPSEGGTRNFVTTILNAAKETGEVSVVADQIGCPTYAPDLAEAIRGLLLSEPEYGVYHLANTGSCSRFDFAKEIIVRAGIQANAIPITTGESGTAVRRPSSSILKNTKQPILRSWQEALQEYMGNMI